MECNDQDPRITKLLRIIDNDMAGDLSVNNLARRVHLSPSHLAHLFKKKTASAPEKYIRNCRIAEADKLLSETRLAIKEVAARTGFASASQLSKAFRRAKGYPPLQGRRKAENATFL
jgi:transcriptional regulator GlxA family with amidase domain